MSKFSSWLDNTFGEDNVNKAVDIFSPALGALGQGSPSGPSTTPTPPTFTPPDTTGSQGGIDALTQQLYAQLLGLMDQQANTDLANEQIGSLSNILNQQTSLAGKDLAASGFASGKATPTNIAPLIQGQQKALAQGVTQIQTAAQGRADANQAKGLDLLTQMRSQLVGEQQQQFDNALNMAMFDYQKWLDGEGLRLSKEEQDAEFFTKITEAALKALPLLLV